MNRTRSLKRQIVGIVLAAQLLCALLLASAAILDGAHSHLRAFDVRLEGHSDSLLGAIQDAEDPDFAVQVDPEELRLPEEDVFAVYNHGGRMLGSSAGAPSELTRRSTNGFRTIRFHGVRYRVLQREAMRVIDRSEFGRTGLRRPVTMVYASPETRVWHQIFESVRFSLIAIFVATALTTLCVAFFLRRALQPLSDLAIAAGGISPPSLSFSVPPSVLRIRELRPLADVLSDAVERLREAFEKEKRFVGDATHELKTAIAVEHSSLQLLMLKRRTEEEYSAGLERLLEDNVRVEALVAQMLLLARLEEAPGTEVDCLDLGVTAQAVVLRLQPVAQIRELELRCACEPQTMVHLAPERAEVLISNLVLNAIQHSHPGTSVEIRVVRCEMGKVALLVTDCGSGIAKEALPHLFERFFREDRSRSRNTGGTGLGLAICRSIVDAARATIGVKSEQGRGTVVTVIFSAA